MNIWMAGALSAAALTAAPVRAQVTPAPQALHLVRSFFEDEAATQIEDALPPHKLVSHQTESHLDVYRGKYSDELGGAADFFGTLDVIVQIGTRDEYYPFHCTLAASAVVVPFSMQSGPTLEVEINNEMLVLRHHAVRCQATNG